VGGVGSPCLTSAPKNQSLCRASEPYGGSTSNGKTFIPEGPRAATPSARTAVIGAEPAFAAGTIVARQGRERNQVSAS
jgi:hypothetical protein